jgi:hypothetical protein
MPAASGGRILGDGGAARPPDGFHAPGPILAHPGQHCRDGARTEVVGDGAEQHVAGGTVGIHQVAAGEPERAVGAHQQVPVGRRHVDPTPVRAVPLLRGLHPEGGAVCQDLGNRPPKERGNAGNKYLLRNVQGRVSPLGKKYHALQPM